VRSDERRLSLEGRRGKIFVASATGATAASRCVAPDKEPGACARPLPHLHREHPQGSKPRSMPKRRDPRSSSPIGSGAGQRGAAGRPPLVRVVGARCRSAVADGTAITPSNSGSETITVPDATKSGACASISHSTPSALARTRTPAPIRIVAGPSGPAPCGECPQAEAGGTVMRRSARPCTPFPSSRGLPARLQDRHHHAPVRSFLRAGSYERFALPPRRGL
jgi:hypothetical protein